jgi:hypothetical protein
MMSAEVVGFSGASCDKQRPTRTEKVSALKAPSKGATSPSKGT